MTGYDAGRQDRNTYLLGIVRVLLIERSGQTEFYIPLIVATFH